MEPISRREFISRLRQLGFKGPFSGGRHQFMSRGQLKARIPNPHKSDIGIELLSTILGQANLKEEWDNHFKQ